jgi:hypothetical protein
MRALKGGIPRAFRSHKSPDGAAYGRYVRAILAQLGELPGSARPTLREAGRAAVELERLGFEQEQARTQRRRRDERRIRRQQVILRTQLLTLEKRLEELAKARPRRSFAETARRAGGVR